MRKILAIFSIAVLLPSVAIAGPDINTYTKGIAEKSGFGAANELTLSQTIGKYIKIILSLVGMVFLVLTIYAGVLWMTAAGEEDKVTKAKNILQASVIGLIIMLASYSITAFVVDRLVGT
jgi:FtsH-binding integral membrane protein